MNAEGFFCNMCFYDNSIRFPYGEDGGSSCKPTHHCVSFGMFETTISAFVDEFPNVLQKRKTLFTAVLCSIMFLLGLPCVTEGGMYVLQLMDWYSAAFSLMIISLLELICISWVYGIDRFMLDISLMIKRTPSTWWRLCWCYITPGTIICLLSFITVNHEAVSYGSYKYPKWSVMVGWMIAMASILPIPILAAVQIWKAEGTLKQRLISCLQPAADWGPALEENRILYRKSLSSVTSIFPQKTESFYKGNEESLCMVRSAPMNAIELPVTDKKDYYKTELYQLP